MDDRFHSKINRAGPNDCWLWTAGLSHGYGQFMVRNEEGKWRPKGAHMLALNEVEPKPFDGAFALHSCDNPPCCNPAHLRWGTTYDNTEDKMKRQRQSKGGARSAALKGKMAKGQNHCNARITEDDVRKIRLDTRKLADIAADYGVGSSNISAIKCGRSWNHVV